MLENLTLMETHWESAVAAHWVATTSSSSSAVGDLSLGFNATVGGASATDSAVPWLSPSSARHINCGLPPEFFFVAPSQATQPTTTINFDPHTLNVIPLLTATPIGSTHVPDEHHHQHQFLNSAARAYGIKNTKPMNVLGDHRLQEANDTSISTSGGNNSSIGGGTTTCQDCGNQAKKDCSHRRCRTCCKSRGYDCATHVKSTWVPAARRRERQLMTSVDDGNNNNNNNTNNNTGSVNSQSTSGAKKPRLAGASQTTTASHTSTSNTTPPRSFDTSSSHQDASFKDSLPGQVRAPAVFKCVRVTSLEDGEDEYAYQAVVRIGGRVFKGFLYDQGLEGRDNNALPNISELHLGGNNNNTHHHHQGGSSSSPILDPPSDMYGGGGLLGGASYGNPIN